MANAMAGGYADYDLENQQLERRRRMAEMLAQNGMGDGPKGGMVGNHYVAPSWTQQLSAALDSPLAAYQMRSIDKQQKELGQRKQSEMTAETKRFADLLSGTPATSQTHVADDQLAYGGAPEDSTTTQVNTPAVPGDRRAALAMALGAKNPALQQWGMSTLTKEQESPYAKIDPSKFTPASIQAFAAAGGLLPLMAGAERAGNEFLYPVAVVVLGGLFAVTLLDAVVTPLLIRRFGAREVQARALGR